MWYDDFVKMADFDDKLKNLNEKVTSGKSKHLLLENELKNLQDKTEKLQTMTKSLYWSKLVFQWWSKTLLNISNALFYFKKTRRYWKDCIMEN